MAFKSGEALREDLDDAEGRTIERIDIVPNEDGDELLVFRFTDGTRLTILAVLRT